MSCRPGNASGENLLSTGMTTFRPSIDPMDPFTAAALGLIPESVENINDVNLAGWTMLMYACYYNRIDVVNFLISNGADRTIQCKKGRTAMMIASINGNVEILKNVFKEDIINLTDFHGMTSLGLSIECGHVEATQYLLSKGANPNVYLGKGTCLMAAVENGHYPIVELLLRHGADLSATNFQGKTAWEVAQESGNTEIANLIRTFEEAGIEPILNLLGLEEYIPLFNDRNICFKEFLYLTEEDMKEIGIKVFGRRRRLAMYLKEARRCYEGLL